MRIRFYEQPEQLNVELIRMGALCEESISCAVKALFDENSEAMIARVNANEEEIDNLERAVESLCMKLLLRQQPVAGDLRAISSALKMISDMERIGDQSQDIAELAEFIRSSELVGKVHISEMAKETVNMVTTGIESFVRKDSGLVQKTIDMDDNVDRLFLEVKNELIALIREDAEDAEYYLDLLMAAKYLERIGDHATNIAEWVNFSITGER